MAGADRLGLKFVFSWTVCLYFDSNVRYVCSMGVRRWGRTGRGGHGVEGGEEKRDEGCRRRMDALSPGTRISEVGDRRARLVPAGLCSSSGSGSVDLAGRIELGAV